jgi:hypothetical protein
MYLQPPCDLPVRIKTGDKFGLKRVGNPNVAAAFQNKPHSGVDLRPHEHGGSRMVYAIADGMVINNTPDAGSYIAIAHGDGIISVYVHLVERKAQQGYQVKAGDVIGTYGDHLHLTLKMNGNNVDPEQFINFTTQQEIDNMFKEELKQAIIATAPNELEKQDKLNALNDNNWAYILNLSGWHVRQEMETLKSTWVNPQTASELNQKITDLQTRLTDAVNAQSTSSSVDLTNYVTKQQRDADVNKAIQDWIDNQPKNTGVENAPTISSPVIENIIVKTKDWYQSKKFLFTSGNLAILFGWLAAMYTSLIPIIPVELQTVVASGQVLVSIIYLLVQGKQDEAQAKSLQWLGQNGSTIYETAKKNNFFSFLKKK